MNIVRAISHPPAMFNANIFVTQIYRNRFPSIRPAAQLRIFTQRLNELSFHRYASWNKKLAQKHTKKNSSCFLLAPLDLNQIKFINLIKNYLKPSC